LENKKDKDNTKLIARNVMEGGYTERRFMHQTHLTEPQGIIEKQNKENLSCQ